MVKRLLSVLTVIAMSFGFVGLTASAASAALPTGITQASIVKPGPDPATVVNDGDEVNQGELLQLRVSYDLSVMGSTVDFKLGGNANLANLASLNNNGVEKYEKLNDDTVRVTFKSAENWPSGITAGVFRLDFQLNDDAGPGPTPIEWEIEGETIGVEVEVKDPNPPVPPVNVTEGYNKVVAPTNINDLVTYKQDGQKNWRFDELNDSILDQVFTYTLSVNVPNGATNVQIPIADQLPAGMQYIDGAAAVAAGGTVPVTVAGKQWDANGTAASESAASGVYNWTVGADGNSFSGTLTANGAAQLTLTYQVKITDKSKIVELLEANQPAAGGSGGFAAALKNTATFKDDIEKSATVNVNGNLAGPCPDCDGVFSKSSDWSSDQKNFITDKDGTIVEPDANIEFAFVANLSEWNGVSPAQTLTENVVITDTLPAQATWSVGNNFIHVNGTSNYGKLTELTELTELTGACDAQTIRAAAEGTYCVDGQTLRINVGKNKATDVTISAKAKLTSLDGAITGDGAGLTQTGSTTVKDGVPYRFRNVANFSYKTNVEGETNKQTDLFPVELPDERDNGINDSSAFSKDAVDPVLNVDPGEAADVGYTFTINTAKTPAVETLQVTDDFDEIYFPITADNLVAPYVAVSGHYDGDNLDQADFDLSLVDGNLVIKFSDAGKAKLNATGKQLVINLSLQTRKFEGKETLRIKNFATLSGVNEDADYWSEDSSEATSYDAEIAVEKRIWNKTDKEWTQLLKTGTNADGTMVQNRFIYQIEFRSYDNFTDDAVINVVDALDESATFIGFVTSDDPNDWSNRDTPTTGTLSKSGIDGAFDAASNEVMLSKAQGTWYPVGETVSFRIMVELEEGTKQFVNDLSWNGTKLPPTKTVVDIVGQPSIDIEKWTEEPAEDGVTPGPAYDEKTGALTNDGYAGDFDTNDSAAPQGKSLKANTPQVINFTVSNNGLDRLLDIKVSDKVNIGDGVVENLECVFPDQSVGTTWAGPMEVASQFNCTGTLTGVKLGETHRDTAKVTATGEINKVPVEDEDTWNAFVKAPVKPEDLASTGMTPQSIAVLLGIAGVMLVGGVLLTVRRRNARA